MAQARSKWKSVNGDEIANLIDSDQFIHKGCCGCGVPIHTFRIPGETIEGRIRPCKQWDRADRSKTAEIEWIDEETAQRMKTAIRLNRRLWKAIQGADLWGRIVRITYKGSVRQPGLRYAEKLYEVSVNTHESREEWKDVSDAGTDRKTKYRKSELRRPGQPKSAGAKNTKSERVGKAGRARRKTTSGRGKPEGKPVGQPIKPATDEEKRRIRERVFGPAGKPDRSIGQIDEAEFDRLKQQRLAELQTK